MACLLPLPLDLQMNIAKIAKEHEKIDSAKSELQRQLIGWCKAYWEYVHLTMIHDEEYMITKRILSEPTDLDDNDAWQDYLNSAVGEDEHEYLDSDTENARLTIEPCDWMRGVRPMAWAYHIPEWATQHYDGNLFY